MRTKHTKVILMRMSFILPYQKRYLVSSLPVIDKLISCFLSSVYTWRAKLDEGCIN